MRTPNGLPVECIRDGLLLEHKHGDHPDYKFPVTVEYIGNSPDLMSEERKQSHAVIYTDGYVIITLFEHVYAMWDNHGRVKAGQMWKKSDWKLSDKSLERVLDWVKANRL